MDSNELYNSKDVVEILGSLKNEVDTMRGMLKRIAKLRKAGDPIHHFFHYWILNNAKDQLNKAQILFNLIEKEEVK